MLLPIVFAVVIALLTIWFLMSRSNENYWKKRGVKFHNKNKLLGPFWDYIVQKHSLSEAFGYLYKEYKNEPAVGIGALFTPSLYVIDPRNVAAVLQSDFQSFNHRGVEPFADQLSDNIPFMNGPRWKLMRQTMSPLFTASKLKKMFYIINRSGKDFVEYLKDNPKTWNGGCFETLTTFCNAAVCCAIFGIDNNSIFVSPFLETAKTFSTPSFIKDLKFTIMSTSPWLAKVLRLKAFWEHEDFVINAITQVIKERKKNNITRHDFADICVSILDNGTIKDPATDYEIEPTFGLLAAQAYFFFIAGVEPCANSIFATLYLLGRHPEILKEVQSEIDDVFDNNEVITYDIATEMEYLNKVLNESMRMFPPIGFLSRQCIKDTILPVGNIKVDVGTRIFTPLYQLHYDPDLYPDPETFDPERFSKERMPNDEIYLPFGRGKRMCMGMRYGRLQVVVSLMHILRHFTVKSVQDGNSIKYKLDPVSLRPINIDVELIPRIGK